jgi:hypothetical protein
MAKKSSPLEQVKELILKYPNELNLSWEGEEGEFTVTLGDNTGTEYGEFAVTPGDRTCFLVSTEQKIPKSFKPAYEALLSLSTQILAKTPEFG